MSDQFSKNDGAQSVASLPPRTGSVIEVTEPLKLLREGYGMRTVSRVLSGWPQAVWVLNCGHHQIIPTWSNGRVNPKPKGKVFCETCWHAEWDKRYAVWISQNDQVSKQPPTIQK